MKLPSIGFVLVIWLDGFEHCPRGFSHLDDAVTVAKKLMEAEEKNGHPKFINAKPSKSGNLKWENSEKAYFEISKTY